MQKVITLKVLPSEAENEFALRNYAADLLGTDIIHITGFDMVKRSIDARGKQVWITLVLLVFIQEPFHRRTIETINFRNVKDAPNQALVIGSGPAGLFAALKLIEKGIKPVILERGKEVRARRRDLAALNKEGIIDPNSNYCFGEGGAGTYSDGKLYTRSNKRGNITRILNLFVQFGADEKILVDAHPHIGTNKLPQIITAIREKIIDCGGELLFGKKVTDFIVQNNKITAVKTSDNNLFEAAAVILATGHSARDIFQLLLDKNILIEMKPFALGVRVEHPQQLIDSIQYHAVQRGTFLPPASYSLVQQVKGRGVFSFCMCPGGIIAPAATNASEIVVNGWSPSKRNNPYANSGMVVSVQASDLFELQKKYGPLAGMYFQQSVEQKAFQYGGGKFVAPAQRLVDMVNNKMSVDMPACSYVPGIHSSSMKEVLPGFIYNSLREAFREFGKKMKGYLTNEALVVATESRTSSPVRIPRNPETFQHPQIKNLYPCSEGAGYAGGIISAAMDGEKVAEAISLQFKV
ncbi:MAG: FAD-dependent protein [Chitinophagaceae bacterium]